MTRGSVIAGFGNVIAGFGNVIAGFAPQSHSYIRMKRIPDQVRDDQGCHCGLDPQSSASKAPSGTKNPPISARYPFLNRDRDDLRPNFDPHYVRVKP